MSTTELAPNPPGSTVKPILYQGDSGTAVIELQRLLNSRGANLAIDGFFGPRTLNAVLRFQQQFGLTPDGAVGQITWAELQKNQPEIRLVDVCRYFDPFNHPQQAIALEWLQSQINTATLNEFAKRWRNQTLIVPQHLPSQQH